MKTLLLALFVCASAAAEEPVAVDLPLLDRDNFADGLRGPSMAQSLALTAGFYEVAHDAIEDAMPERPQLRKWVIAAFDVGTTVLAPLPITDVWLHEEYHRAVMSNRGIGSFNEVYKFELGAESISVSRVRDEDLVRLKAEHPADLVRLHAAGVEGEYALVQRMQKDVFFGRTGGWHAPLYLIVKLSSAAYIGSGTSDDVIEETHQWEREEGADVSRRDFAGHDFTAWMYDLSRRDEPYTARGLHPSGTGIRRYITPDMLTGEERAFLERQGTLQALNFLDPRLAGFDEWTTGKTRWAASAGHVLTPFGYTVDLNVMLSRGGRDLFVVLRRYTNRQRSFPGLEAELPRLRLRRFAVSPRLVLWQQPRGLEFRTDEARLGGLVGVRVDTPVHPRLRAFAETSVKSEGWVLGNVHLGSSFELRFGVSVVPHF